MLLEDQDICPNMYLSQLLFKLHVLGLSNGKCSNENRKCLSL